MNNIITFFTQSSEDPAKTSATLTGILIALSSYLQQYFSFIPVIHDFYASPLGQNSSQICTGLGFVIGGAWFLFGLIRKATNKVEAVRGLRV